MRVINRRTTALGVGLVATLVSSAILVGGVSAAAQKAVPRLVFPVVGPVSYKDDFGEPRAKWPHPGNDLMAEKRQIAVAAEAGKIKYWTRSASAGCMLYLYGKSGTSYQYIHLNNDLTDGNDNRGKCVAGTAYAPGLKDGASVRGGRRSASWATPATRTASTRTSTSRFTRTTARPSTPSRTWARRCTCSSPSIPR